MSPLILAKFLCAAFLTAFISCSSAPDAAPPSPANTATAAAAPPSPPPAPPAYDSLTFTSEQNLAADEGTKSVIFNRAGTRLYAMNLEGMSIYEYDAQARRLMRAFAFKPTPGRGWDYEKDISIPSLQEKPVEACLSKDESLLYVSLHNAGGVVPLPLSGKLPSAGNDATSTKKVYLLNDARKKTDSFSVPLIATGATPKVIARTADDKYVLVSNWHSHTVSVLEHTSAWPILREVAKVPVAAIPRGIAVDDARGLSYVAIMGSNALSVINRDGWKKEEDIPAASNPRHVVMDDAGRLFVSFNKIAEVACIDPVTKKTLFKTATAAQPRSIVLSKNGRFLFVTCYSGNTIDIYKVEKDGFRTLYQLPCKGKPVGIDIRETDDTLEAWVCNYTGGNLTIFSFKKHS